MRLGRFVSIALLASLATGLGALLSGIGLGGAFLLALGVLVGLQVAYFLFLYLAAVRVKRDRKD